MSNLGRISALFFVSTSAHSPTDSRARLGAWLQRPAIQNGIVGLILLNAVVLGLETSARVMAAVGPQLVLLDRALLSVLVVEIVLRLWVHRSTFFRDPWSVFDFLVVVIALVPASGPFAVLRALRVLRVLRLLTVVPSMRRVVGGLLAAIPGLSSIAAVLGLMFYVFAVIASKLFGATFPDWFGDLGLSLYTLFQVMTLESWSMGIVRPVMEVYPPSLGLLHPFHPDGHVHHAEPVHRGHRQRDAELLRGRQGRDGRCSRPGPSAHRSGSARRSTRPARRDCRAA